MYGGLTEKDFKLMELRFGDIYQNLIKQIIRLYEIKDTEQDRKINEVTKDQRIISIIDKIILEEVSEQSQLSIWKKNGNTRIMLTPDSLWIDEIREQVFKILALLEVSETKKQF